MLTKREGHELSINEASWDYFLVILIIFSLFDLENRANSSLLYEEQQIEISKFQLEKTKKRNHTEMALLENQIFVRFIGDDDSIFGRKWWQCSSPDMIEGNQSLRKSSPPWEIEYQRERFLIFYFRFLLNIKQGIKDI